jgi:hypothetical protein
MSETQLALAALEMVFVAKYNCTTKTTYEKNGSRTKVHAGIEAALPRVDDDLLALARAAGKGLAEAGVKLDGAAIAMGWSTEGCNNKQEGVLRNFEDHSFVKREAYNLAGIDFTLILDMYVSACARVCHSLGACARGRARARRVAPLMRARPVTLHVCFSFSIFFPAGTEAPSARSYCESSMPRCTGLLLPRPLRPNSSAR